MNRLTNILSQAEIDELLNALSSGSPEAEPERNQDANSVKVYDFRTANKFPKEQMRTLNIVFDTFAQLLSNKLGSILRTSCECGLLSVEELSFNEFNNSLPFPVILAIMGAPPMEGSIMFQVSPEATYMVINRLLGGTTKNQDYSKQFTEIEIVLVERVLRQCMRTFDESWEKVFEVTSQLDRIETSAQFAQIAALNEPVAVATLEIKMGDESGLISICIPHESIEPVAKQLNTKLWFAGAGESKRVVSQRSYIENKLIHSKIDITAYFEETSATVADIVNLQVGDVIRLNHKAGEPVKIKLQHITKFKADIGTSGLDYAVQIVEVIKGDKENDNNVPR